MYQYACYVRKYLLQGFYNIFDFLLIQNPCFHVSYIFLVSSEGFLKCFQFLSPILVAILNFSNASRIRFHTLPRMLSWTRCYGNLQRKKLQHRFSGYPAWQTDYLGIFQRCDVITTCLTASCIDYVNARDRQVCQRLCKSSMLDSGRPEDFQSGVQHVRVII